MLSTYLFHVWLFFIRAKRSGDIEPNPGPKPNSCQSFSICHWNLNSISAHNFIKLSLLKPIPITSLFTNLMLFVYQKLIFTLASQMMMTVWKFPVIIYLEKTIHLILNTEVFVFIIEIHFL